MIGAITAGFLGGAGAAVLGDYESIQTITLASSQAFIDFTSIPSTYSHLQIRGISLFTSGGGQTYLQANGITSGYGYSHYLNGNGTSAVGGNSSSGTSIAIEAATVGHSTTSPYASVTDILDYSNTNKYKTVRALGGVDLNGSGEVNLMSGTITTTAAISTIRLNFGINAAQYSTYALYGVK